MLIQNTVVKTEWRDDQIDRPEILRSRHRIKIDIDDEGSRIKIKLISQNWLQHVLSSFCEKVSHGWLKDAIKSTKLEVQETLNEEFKKNWKVTDKDSSLEVVKKHFNEIIPSDLSNLEPEDIQELIHKINQNDLIWKRAQETSQIGQAAILEAATLPIQPQPKENVLQEIVAKTLEPPTVVSQQITRVLKPPESPTESSIKEPLSVNEAISTVSLPDPIATENLSDTQDQVQITETVPLDEVSVEVEESEEEKLKRLQQENFKAIEQFIEKDIGAQRKQLEKLKTDYPENIFKNISQELDVVEKRFKDYQTTYMAPGRWFGMLWTTSVNVNELDLEDLTKHIRAVRNDIDHEHERLQTDCYGLQAALNATEAFEKIEDRILKEEIPSLIGAQAHFLEASLEKEQRNLEYRASQEVGSKTLQGFVNYVSNVIANLESKIRIAKEHSESVSFLEDLALISDEATKVIELKKEFIARVKKRIEEFESKQDNLAQTLAQSISPNVVVNPTTLAQTIQKNNEDLEPYKKDKLRVSEGTIFTSSVEKDLEALNGNELVTYLRHVNAKIATAEERLVTVEHAYQKAEAAQKKFDKILGEVNLSLSKLTRQTTKTPQLLHQARLNLAIKEAQSQYSSFLEEKNHQLNSTLELEQFATALGRASSKLQAILKRIKKEGYLSPVEQLRAAEKAPGVLSEQDENTLRNLIRNAVKKSIHRGLKSIDAYNKANSFFELPEAQKYLSDDLRNSLKDKIKAKRNELDRLEEQFLSAPHVDLVPSMTNPSKDNLTANQFASWQKKAKNESEKVAEELEATLHLKELGKAIENYHKVWTSSNAEIEHYEDISQIAAKDNLEATIDVIEEERERLFNDIDSPTEFIRYIDFLNHSAKKIEIAQNNSKSMFSAKHEVLENTKKTLQKLVSAANDGNIQSIFELGDFYRKEGQNSLAVQWLEKAADLGHPRAREKLGTIFLYGGIVKADPKKAVEYFKQAAEKGELLSKFYYGYCLFKGIGVQASASKGLELLEEAADANSTKAMLFLGDLYLQGNGVEKNQEIALEFYGTAASLGNVSAMFKITKACLLNPENAIGIEQRAEAWLPMLIEKKNTSVLFDLANLFEDFENKNLAIDYYQAAATFQHPKAITALGILHEESGQLQEAISYYKRAAELYEPTALNLLGNCYASGTGVEKNWPLAAAMFFEASKAGNLEGTLNLGCCYARGLGVNKNASKAIQCFYEIEHRNIQDESLWNVQNYAIFNLGLCFAAGFGIEKNVKFAEYLTTGLKGYQDQVSSSWISSLASSGISEQDLQSRLLNSNGKHFDKSESQVSESSLDSLKWYIENFSQKNGESTTFLGQLLTHIGDFQGALLFYSIAVQMGDLKASNEIGNLLAMAQATRINEKGETTEVDISDEKWKDIVSHYHQGVVEGLFQDAKRAGFDQNQLIVFRLAINTGLFEIVYEMLHLHFLKEKLLDDNEKAKFQPYFESRVNFDELLTLENPMDIVKSLKKGIIHPKALNILYRKACEKKLIEERSPLGRVFKDVVMKEDYYNALKILSSAAQLSNYPLSESTVEALLNTGCCYAQGLGVEKNLRAAMMHFQFIKDLLPGSPETMDAPVETLTARALFNLGLLQSQIKDPWFLKEAKKNLMFASELIPRAKDALASLFPSSIDQIANLVKPSLNIDQEWMNSTDRVFQK